jgi:predicted amidohydrolase YtcJ
VRPRSHPQPALVVIGRIATLAGDEGFGWTGGLAVTDGRVAAIGQADEIRALAGPRTRRVELAPDEVAMPGLTDAHLHLAEAALAADRADLSTTRTLAEGLERVTTIHAERPDGSWLLGQGWDAERWGGWPAAEDLERVAPGRRVALWAHDHHALWVSQAALDEAGVERTTTDPDGGVIRRDVDGSPSGILHEAAARLVSDRIPPPAVEELGRAIARFAPRLLASGLVAVHDPGMLRADPDLEVAHAAYLRLAGSGGVGLRIHASLRQEALDTALRLGLRSGEPIGDARARMRIGWMKCFADGTLGSRTAAMLEPFERERDRPPPPAGERGMFVTPPGELAALVHRAAEGGIASQIHAIGDAAARASLDALAGTAGRTQLAPRVEHVQLLDSRDVPRFAADGIAASIQPIHLRSDAEAARRAWGDRAERSGYPWASLARSGALIPFGTDAPVEPWDPWPGLALAVMRQAGGWPGPFGSAEALDLARALRAACVDAARSAGEHDRGRLVPGQRADLVVVPAVALIGPVEPDGPLASARPRLVLLDGDVAAET